MSGILYTNMKVFHFKDKIDSLPKSEDIILPPIHVRIKPTNVCNHSCRYCAYRASHMQLGMDMDKKAYIPKKKMMEIIDDIISMDVKAVTFSGGGEPFCYPYFLDVVNKVAESSVKFAALTNGSRLAGELAEQFAYKGTWLRVSIEGWDAKSYSLYRSVPDDEFNKVLKNMENFKKLNGKCCLGVSLIVDNHNAEHIYHLIQLLKNIGVDSVKVSPCIVDNDGLRNKRYHKPIFEIVKEQVKESITNLQDKEFEVYDAYHELDAKFTKEYSWCPYIQILTVIGADLNVYSCQDKAYNFNEGLIGSLREKRFEEFWISDKNNFFKINPSRDCQNHCVANTKNKMLIQYIDSKKEHRVFV